MEQGTHHSTVDIDALVVGASWAGIWNLHLLKSKGLKVSLVDACDNIGGSWFYTRYPGCRVDTEVPLYEYSDARLWRNWTWSQRFPDRQEIQQYLCWVCDQLQLRDNMKFGVRVQRASWDSNLRRWNVITSDGTCHAARYLILCTGYVTIPNFPHFTGADSFVNKFHSAEWPENIEWRDKEIGVIGTGASGLQIIEAIAPGVKKLIVFQRTPNLATPMRQVDYDSKLAVELKKSYPQLLQKKLSPSGYFAHTSRLTFEDDADARRSFYNSLWARGGLSFWHGNYKDMLRSRDANAEAYAFWRQKVRKRIRDTATAQKLAPEKPPHAFGAKRPSLETSYFDSFNLQHVELVDVKEDPIRWMTATGVQTNSKFHRLDMLVYATGFDTFIGSALMMDIRGVGGMRLLEKWDASDGGAGVWTSFGLMTAGFPNMFFPLGPQGPGGVGITPQIAEIQGAWIASCVEHMEKANYNTIEALVDAERKWHAEVDRSSRESLITDAESSWYMGANISGRRRQPLCYCGGIDRYAKLLRNQERKGYPGFSFS